MGPNARATKGPSFWAVFRSGAPALEPLQLTDELLDASPTERSGEEHWLIPWLMLWKGVAGQMLRSRAVARLRWHHSPYWP
jgi:hypothetical protein